MIRINLKLNDPIHGHPSFGITLTLYVLLCVFNLQILYSKPVPYHIGHLFFGTTMTMLFKFEFVNRWDAPNLNQLRPGLNQDAAGWFWDVCWSSLTLGQPSPDYHLTVAAIVDLYSTILWSEICRTLKIQVGCTNARGKKNHLNAFLLGLQKDISKVASRKTGRIFFPILCTGRIKN